MALGSLALLLWMGSGAALAQTKIAVLGIEPLDAPPESATRVAEALKAQVRQSPGFKLVLGKTLEEIKLVFGCVDEKPDCMARVGRSLQAGKLLWGSLKKSGSSYHLTIKLLDVPSATVEKFISESVSGAEVADPRALIERLTRSFLPGARGSLRVSASVAGATVQVSAREMGETQPGGLVIPDLKPGTYEVRVTKEHYRPWVQNVVVAGGQTTEIEAQLEALKTEGGDQPPATQPLVTPKGVGSRTGWKAAFWTMAALTVGFGAAIVGTGVTVLNKQSDKEAAINGYKGPDGSLFGRGVEDVCEVTGSAKGDASAIASACDSGHTFATLTNVFVALTAVSAVVTGIFYWKAYIQKPTADEQQPEERSTFTRRSSPTRWMVAPAVGPTGGGLGLGLRF